MVSYDDMIEALAGNDDVGDFGHSTSPGSPVVTCASDPYVNAVDSGDQVGQSFFLTTIF